MNDNRQSQLQQCSDRMVMDPYSSQVNLFYRDDIDESGRKRSKRKNHIPRPPISRVWHILKTLNSNRKCYLEWFWSPKKKSVRKDKGFGSLITDEEKRFLFCFERSNVDSLDHLTRF